MVSFIYAGDIGTFLNLYDRYRTVEIKRFKQIFIRTFRSRDLTRLGLGVTNRPGNEGVQEAKGMVQLLQCLEVYSQAIVYHAYTSVAIYL